jgi:hypothetical protein
MAAAKIAFDSSRASLGRLLGQMLLEEAMKPHPENPSRGISRGEGDPGKMLKLIIGGADLSVRDPEKNWNALMWIARRGHSMTLAREILNNDMECRAISPADREKAAGIAKDNGHFGTATVILQRPRQQEIEGIRRTEEYRRRN